MSGKQRAAQPSSTRSVASTSVASATANSEVPTASPLVAAASASPPTSSDLSAKLSTGSAVRIITNQQTFEGTVVAYDALSGIIILDVGSEQVPQRDLVMITAAFVNRVELLSLQADSGKQLPTLPPISQAYVQQKLARALDERQREVDKIGRGVPESAQTIFDALDKTMSCSWDGSTIVVMNAVRILPPYLAASCSGGSANALARVKKVLEAELAKMHSSSTSPTGLSTSKRGNANASTPTSVTFSNSPSGATSSSSFASSSAITATAVCK